MNYLSFVKLSDGECFVRKLSLNVFQIGKQQLISLHLCLQGKGPAEPTPQQQSFKRILLADSFDSSSFTGTFVAPNKIF